MEITKSSSPADKLRAALKAAGFNARRVSVRHDHSTLYVTLRDASASLSKVTAIANTFSVVHRCEAGGEILSGGNTFVQVRYHDDLVTPVQASILAVLRPAPDDVYVDLPGGFRAIKVSRAHGGATYLAEVRIKGPTFEDGTIAVGLEHAAKRMAVAQLDAAALGQGSAA